MAAAWVSLSYGSLTSLASRDGRVLRRREHAWLLCAREQRPRVVRLTRGGPREGLRGPRSARASWPLCHAARATSRRSDCSPRRYEVPRTPGSYASCRVASQRLYGLLGSADSVYR